MINRIPLAAVAAVFWLMAIAILPDAVATENDNNAMVIEKHKAFLAEESQNQLDLDDDVTYHASEKARAARHANKFLKDVREGRS